MIFICLSPHRWEVWYEMRFSQGASYGRYGELYHPEMFNDREEVIVFKREEFASAFKSMMNQIEFINDIDLKFNRKDDYKLLGLWPQIIGQSSYN